MGLSPAQSTSTPKKKTKQNMKKSIMMVGILIAGLVSQGQSTDLMFYDATFTEVTIDGLPFVAAGGYKEIPAFWGLWNSSTSIFSPLFTGNGLNGLGFLGFQNVNGSTSNEIMTGISQKSSGEFFNIPAGTLLSLGFYDQPVAYNDTYPRNNELAKAVLTDSSWLAPAWSSANNIIVYSFTENTQAVFGTFSYNGGSEKIGLSTSSVPEPSALSLLIVGLAGLAVMRRRRS